MSFSIEVHLSPEDLARALRADVRHGLTSEPKYVPPKWLYDERGSQLFDEITRLPEYYPTESERRLLRKVANDVAALTSPDTLVELGSGSSDKTRTLLDALAQEGSIRRFVPFDVSEAPLRAAGEAICDEYAGLDVHAVVGDFDRHLGDIPRGGRRLVAFLGSTIGNFGPEDRKEFLRRLTDGFAEGDRLLLGVDLLKDVDRIELAYNDAAGATARFTKNLIDVLNRELEGTLDPSGFDHDARWDPENEWVEIGLRSRRDQSARLEEIDLGVDFAAGELVRTEVSSKFRREGLEAELAESGLATESWWDNSEVALVLVRSR